MIRLELMREKAITMTRDSGLNNSEVDGPTQRTRGHWSSTSFGAEPRFELEAYLRLRSDGF